MHLGFLGQRDILSISQSAALSLCGQVLTQTSFAGNVSALSISYVNTGGSENYILRVTCTYSGVDAPSISVTANGQSTSELRAAT